MTRLERFFLRLIGHRCVEPVAMVRFSHATLCLDCSMLTESKNDHCIACGAKGGALLRIGQPIDGPRVRKVFEKISR